MTTVNGNWVQGWFLIPSAGGGSSTPPSTPVAEKTIPVPKPSRRRRHRTGVFAKCKRLRPKRRGASMKRFWSCIAKKTKQLRRRRRR